ncbi:hypothetical protein BJY01DRAFT_212905 [Aspergillus pseudoustus]|uniref:SWIM-type domain-containing protein n=1 Tax=Aspergillus pseudoustus TaxID=1810923 RepID=A0ABR4K4J9_9EURO
MTFIRPRKRNYNSPPRSERQLPLFPTCQYQTPSPRQDDNVVCPRHGPRSLVLMKYIEKSECLHGASLQFDALYYCDTASYRSCSRTCTTLAIGGTTCKHVAYILVAAVTSYSQIASASGLTHPQRELTSKHLTFGIATVWSPGAEEEAQHDGLAPKYSDFQYRKRLSRNH